MKGIDFLGIIYLLVFHFYFLLRKWKVSCFLLGWGEQSLCSRSTIKLNLVAQLISQSYKVFNGITDYPYPTTFRVDLLK
jgi:hypothetical protein